MPGRATKIEQATLGENHHAVSVGENVLVVLRLDLDALDAFELFQSGHVDLVIEMPDVTDDRLVLHLRHVVDSDDVLVARRRHEDVARFHHVFESGDLISFHRRLQRADRIDLGDDHPGALSVQRLRATLTDIAIAANDGNFSGEHHVRRAQNAVGQ